MKRNWFLTWMKSVSNRRWENMQLEAKSSPEFWPRLKTNTCPCFEYWANSTRREVYCKSQSISSQFSLYWSFPDVPGCPTLVVIQMTVDGWVDPPSWVHRASSWFRWGILVLGSRTLGLADPLLLVEVAWVSEGIPPLSMEPHNCQHHSIAGHTSRKVGSPRRPFWKRQSDPAMLFEGSGDASPMKSATPYVTFGELGNAPPPRYSWPENIAGIQDRKHRRSMISWQAVACGAKWRKRLDYTMLVLDLVPEVWDDGRLAWSNGCLPIRLTHPPILGIALQKHCNQTV